MDFYTEPQSDLPVLAEVDVLVAGGGPAGIGAALRAARLGCKTMVIEMQDCLGGMATAGMMSHWGGNSSSKILQEIFQRAATMGPFYGETVGHNAGENAINHDVQKILFDDMAREAGVEVLFYTMVCGAVVENHEIRGVIIQNKSGRSLIRAKRVIDATGDGDVAAACGVPFIKGREEDGKMQPATLMFKIGGVDYSRAVTPGSFETLDPTDKGELQALGRKHIPAPAGHVLLYAQPQEGVICCNMTNVTDVDGTNAVDLTRALTTCRSQLRPIIQFLREYAPGYENCWLMSVGSLLGIRETRHFQGEQTLQPDDILTARVYENWVVRRAFFNFDVHNLNGPGLDANGIQHKWAQPDSYTIPYGCLIPVGIEGLLLSGRNISGGHLAHSNFRIMSVCLALGEAAGTAAALSVTRSVPLRGVNVREIQEIVGE